MTFDVPADLERFLQSRWPGHKIVDVKSLAPDDTAGHGTRKAGGYGVPLRIGLVDESGQRRDLVLHFAAANVFGHDRRADRADEMLLAYDTFAHIPHHARALDVGVVDAEGRLQSLRGAGEFWLLTEWAPGRIYAEDLRRIVKTFEATAADVARAEALAGCLVELHVPVGDDGAAYTRAIRDLVGHGEGIFGIVDGFPADVPGAPRARLQALEERCLAWRWRLKDRHHRLRRTHGDFHPFNVVLDDDDRVGLLDASRGGHGDPADDVTCMAINYVFFALLEPKAWPTGLGVLWRRFWATYLEGTGDVELGEVAAPFFAWRALVLTNPRWYPAVSESVRTTLLGFVERLLEAPRFDPELAEELFR